MKVRIFQVIALLLSCSITASFTLTMMGARRGKGNLKGRLEDNISSKKSTKTQSGVSNLNQGKGQEITGVTLPSPGECIISIENVLKIQ